LTEQPKLHEYVQKFMEDGSKVVNYYDLIEDIQNYDFMADQSQPPTAHSVKSGLTDVVAKNEPKTVWDMDYVVLDQKKVP
jgi:hypothetical protein